MKQKLTKYGVKYKTMLVWSNGPFKVGNILIVALAADVDDLSEQFISVGGSFCFVHMQHQLLYNLHQVLFGYLGEQTPVQQRSNLKTHECKSLKDHLVYSARETECPQNSFKTKSAQLTMQFLYCE